MKKALLQLHVAILLWGATAVLGKLIGVDETWLVFYRTGITCISLLLANIFLKEIKWLPINETYNLIGAGFLLGLHWVCFFASAKYANVAVSLICLSCTSFFTLFIEALAFNKKINRNSLLLSLLAIVSVVLLFYSDFKLQKGVIYGILAAVFVAAVPVLQKKEMQKHNESTISFYNMLGGFLILCGLLPIYLQYVPQPNWVPKTLDWMYLCMLSWLCTIITMRLALNALKKVSAFTMNLLLNLEPIYGIMLAYLILDEHKSYNIFFYIGILLLIIVITAQTYLIKKKDAV